VLDRAHHLVQLGGAAAGETAQVEVERADALVVARGRDRVDDIAALVGTSGIGREKIAATAPKISSSSSRCRTLRRPSRPAQIQCSSLRMARMWRAAPRQTFSSMRADLPVRSRR
jgi:hypothetical protein